MKLTRIECGQLIEFAGAHNAKYYFDEMMKLAVKPTTPADSLATISDSADWDVQELHLFGNSEQDGTPTPDAPVSIVNVVNPTVTACGKNLLKNSATSQTVNGVTFTVNDDGTVLVNGTASAQVVFYIQTSFKFKKNTEYILSGCPAGGTSTTYSLSGDNSLSPDYGNGAKQSARKDDYTAIVYIVIRSGYTANNLLFKPMISYDGGEYEPYTDNSVQYTVTLRSVGDVKDELIVYADGTGKLIQRIDSKLDSQTTTSNHSDCILSTPIITELSAQEVLRTYYGTTNLFTDQSGDVSVKYVADTQLYIDNKFNELATAMVASTSEEV